MAMGAHAGAPGGAAAPAAAPAAEAPKAEEKTEFDVKLAGFEAAAKIKVIKEVRAITSLGLKEAKELVSPLQHAHRSESLCCHPHLKLADAERLGMAAGSGSQISSTLASASQPLFKVAAMSRSADCALLCDQGRKFHG